MLKRCRRASFCFTYFAEKVWFFIGYNYDYNNNTTTTHCLIKNKDL